MKTFPLLIHAGSPPLRIPVASTTLDLTTVTAVTLTPLLPDKTTGTPWTATLVATEGQTMVLPTAADILYSWTGSELTQKGIWRLEVLFYVNTAICDADPTSVPTFRVVDQWGSP